MTVQEFLDSMDGTAKVSRELGIPLTTVASWGQRNRVPEWRVPALVALAVKKGKPVPPNLVKAA